VRPRILITAIVAAVLTVGISGAPASATGFEPEPWRPYQATDFVAPAGRYCDFELAVTAVEDDEEVRVSARYADGAVRVYEYRGKLVGRFTNMATGESVIRDLSGHAWVEMYPDGVTMKSFTGLGPFGAGFRATDGYPRGYYRLDGLHSITFAPDGTRDMAVDRGPAENLCATLA
jgi:hypothetical protein